MDYIKECSSILERLNDEGQKVAWDFLKAIQSNERNQKGTSQERLAEIRTADAAKKAESNEEHEHFQERMKDESKKFAALKRRTISKQTTLAAYCNFFCEVGNWLPSFILWNPYEHGTVIETIFTAGYKAAKAEERKKQAQKKKADVKR